MGLSLVVSVRRLGKHVGRNYCVRPKLVDKGDAASGFVDMGAVRAGPELNL